MEQGLYFQLQQKKGGPTKRTSVFVTGLLLLSLTLLLISVLAAVSILSAFNQTSPSPHSNDKPCTDPCSFVLVESIPEGLSFNSSTSNPSTFWAWQRLMSEAQSSLDIASFYWTLTNEDTGTQDPSAAQGEEVLQSLASLSKKLSVRIAVNAPNQSQKSDLQQLSQAGADIRAVNVKDLTKGVLHTKFWVVDQKHFYIGSANMDWRSLTQVKELGALVFNCSCLAADLLKIFEAYWFLGDSQVIPSPWPSRFSTDFNQDSPQDLRFNQTEAKVYLSSSPPPFCASGRTSDLQAILGVIDDAQSFVYIAVMNYLPTMEFSQPKKYWGSIDSALRRVAYERRVSVRLLISCWQSSQPVMFSFLRSLSALQEAGKLDVQVRVFVVPSSASQKKIPFARVNHNKYMVTDRTAYIGTSNWSGDYFVNTAGVALVVQQNQDQESGEQTVQEQLREVFERDWNSAYSTPLGSASLTDDNKDLCTI